MGRGDFFLEYVIHKKNYCLFAYSDLYAFIYISRSLQTQSLEEKRTAAPHLDASCKTLPCSEMVPCAKLSSSQHNIDVLNLAWPVAMGVAVLHRQSDV